MLFLVVFFLIAANAFSADVKNERVRQEGNRVVFEYDLEGDKETEIGITLTIEGKKYTAKELHLEGDYGKVTTGKNKHVYWNVLQDFPGGLNGDLRASIYPIMNEKIDREKLFKGEWRMASDDIGIATVDCDGEKFIVTNARKRYSKWNNEVFIRNIRKEGTKWIADKAIREKENGKLIEWIQVKLEFKNDEKFCTEDACFRRHKRE